MPLSKKSMRSRRAASEHAGQTPSALLKKIGLRGKEVVRIIKEEWGWEVEEPHALQTEKIYHTPESRARRQDARRGEDFFIGEGELYAFILDQGGVGYLLPGEDFSEEELPPTQVQEQETTPVEESRSVTPSPLKEWLGSSRLTQDSTQTTIEIEDSSDAMSVESYSIGPQERKWKRRKKLSTTRGKSVEREPTPKPTPKKQSSKTAKSPAGKRTKKASARESKSAVKAESIPWNPSAGLDAKTNSEYQASLTAKGWRAQLLRDVEVHLLRAVAAISRVQTKVTPSDGREEVFRPSEGAGPHAKGSTEILQELEALSISIQASQRDLISMVSGVIAQAERSNVPDRIDVTGRIGIPTFVSTGPESLTLMRDVERFLLYFVAAVRRYQRTKNTAVNCDSDTSSQATTSRDGKRAELRALQLRIEESSAELQEITLLVSTQVKNQQRTPGAKGSTRSVRAVIAEDTA